MGELSGQTADRLTLALLLQVLVIVQSVFAAFTAQLQLSQSVVSNLHGPAAVDEAVGGLEVPVEADGALVQIDHPLPATAVTTPTPTNRCPVDLPSRCRRSWKPRIYYPSGSRRSAAHPVSQSVSEWHETARRRERGMTHIETASAAVLAQERDVRSVQTHAHELIQVLVSQIAHLMMRE